MITLKTEKLKDYTGGAIFFYEFNLEIFWISFRTIEGMIGGISLHGRHRVFFLITVLFV